MGLFEFMLRGLTMVTILWTVDFNTGARMFVSASTVKMAIKNAVQRYNKDINGHLNSADITMVYAGKIENQCPVCEI